MSTLAAKRPCRCGSALDVRRVRTDIGISDVGACPECDRRTCGYCNRKTGTLFVPGATKCDHCGGPAVLG